MKVHLTTWHVFMSCVLVMCPDLHSKTNLFQRQLVPGHDNAVKQENENLVCPAGQSCDNQGLSVFQLQLQKHLWFFPLWYILNVKNHITCGNSPEIVVRYQQSQTKLFSCCLSVHQEKKEIIKHITVSRQVSIKVLRNSQTKLPPSNSWSAHRGEKKKISIPKLLKAVLCQVGGLWFYESVPIVQIKYCNTRQYQ